MPTLAELQATGPVLYPTTFVDTLTGRPAGILRPDGTILHAQPSTTGTDNHIGRVVWNGETNLLGNGRYTDSTKIIAHLAKEGLLDDPIDVPTVEAPDERIA